MIQAFSDPDGDGVYDQRLFQAKEGAKNAVVLPLPEAGAYKTTGPVFSTVPAAALPGFEKVDNGDYAFSAAQLHELFGNNTLVLFASGASKSVLGCVLLSAGAFDDVPGLGWYADKVAWAVEEGIAAGTGDGNFEPGSDCTHAQILTFLWRAEGKLKAAKAPVTVEEWYQDAINWAYEKGMIDDSFDGGKPCTRVAAVSYMWQAAGKHDAKASDFEDMDGYGEDYIKAVNWANEQGIARGVAEGQFAPGNVCNRATIVTFLQRAYGNK